MKIENLKSNEIEKVMNLENICFGYLAEDNDVIIDRMITFNQGCFGIFENNDLIGYSTSEIRSKPIKIQLNTKASINHIKSGKVLYITTLAVLPEYQNKGLGNKLIKRFIKLAKRLKLNSIYLRTSKARRFYENNGFQFIEHISKQKDSYDIMELKLSPK